MKSIQLVGANFPKIRYSFMSKIKPFKPNHYLEFHPEGNGFFINTIYSLLDKIDQKTNKRLEANKVETNDIENNEKRNSKESSEVLKREKLNFVMVCNDFKKFVKNNANMNPSHSFFYRNRFTLRLLTYLCCKFNLIHTCGYSNDQYDISYHVLDSEKFKNNLENWSNFQIASIMQKPYQEFLQDPSLDEYKRKNIINTIAFASLTILSDDLSNKVYIDEVDFYNHIANLLFLCKEIRPEVDSGLWDIVNKTNVEEYKLIYKEVLVNSPFKDYVRYYVNSKKICITNTNVSRQALLKYIPKGIKNNFWILGKKKILGKNYDNPLTNSVIFKDFLFLLSQNCLKMNAVLSNCLNIISNNKTSQYNYFKRAFLYYFLGIFLTIYGAYATFNSIIEYLRDEKKIFDDLKKENLDLIEFNLVSREISDDANQVKDEEELKKTQS